MRLAQLPFPRGTRRQSSSPREDWSLKEAKMYTSSLVSTSNIWCNMASKSLSCPTSRHFQHRAISLTLSAISGGMCYNIFHILPGAEIYTGICKEECSTCLRARIHISSKKQTKIGAKVCQQHVHLQRTGNELTLFYNSWKQPVHLMLQHENAAVPHIYTHISSRAWDRGRRPITCSTAGTGQYLEITGWSSPGPAKHSTVPLSVSVKLPPGKLRSKWKTLPWLPERDLK